MPLEPGSSALPSALAELLLSGAHGIAAILIERGLIARQNAAAIRAFGDRVGARYEELFEPESQTKARLAIERGEACTLELQVSELYVPPIATMFVAAPVPTGLFLLSAAAREVYSERMGQVLLATNDQLTNLVRELSVRKAEVEAARDELERARAELERIGQLREHFVAAISHDLRSPLQGISLAAEMLGTDAEGESLEAASVRECAGWIRENTAAMGRLIDRMLMATALETGAPLETRPVSLIDVARRAMHGLEPAAKRAGVTLGLADLDGSGAVEGDDLYLGEAITNLVSNAIRHSPRGARVTVQLREEEERIRCTVLDEGPGVPREVRPQVFERFRRFGKHGGQLGLGLYITRTIIERHAGAIWIEEPSSGGAAFVFELPRSRGSSAVPPRA